MRYRLDARGRIGAVERLEPGRQTLTVIEEYARATPGGCLPARRRTSARDIRTGACLGREQFREAHCRVDHVWLPRAGRSSLSASRGLTALRVEFSSHQLL